MREHNADGHQTQTLKMPSHEHRRAGDRGHTLMRELYERHSRPLWRYAFRLTGDGARAEDVVQETLLRAWRHLDITHGVQRSRMWLYTVARNIVIDESRTARFRNEVSSSGATTMPEPAGPDELASAVDRLVIGEALTKLPPEHRAVVGRSYYLGLTTAQIAKDLQIAEGTVKSRLHYASRKLRHILPEMGVTR